MMRAFSLIVLSVVSYVSFAQDFRAAPPLPDFPQHYQTTEYEIQVDLIADGLSNPWSIAFLPDGDMLVTERAGRLRLIRGGQLEQIPVGGTPDVKITVLGGLLDVLLHPEFSSNRIVYLSYAKGREEDDLSTTALARARLNADTLVGLEDIFIANSWSQSPTNFGGRT
jgi:glucose/arabinose dehydrogenase